jgi:hypothetical protein
MRVYDQPKPFNVLHINRTFSKIKSYIAFLSRIVTIANFFFFFFKFLEESFCFYKKNSEWCVPHWSADLHFRQRRIAWGREEGKLYLQYLPPPYPKRWTLFLVKIFETSKLCGPVFPPNGRTESRWKYPMKNNTPKAYPVQIRIRVQGLLYKLFTFYSWEKSNFLDHKMQYIYPYASLKEVLATGKASSPQKRSSSTSKQ